VPLLASGAVLAQELKIGYVNSERVLREPHRPRRHRPSWRPSSASANGADRPGRQAQGAADKLEKDAPTLAESERSRRQRELVEQDRDLQRKRREFQEDLNQRKNEELAGVVERANRVIKQIFEPRSTT
jgi:outer membrane protein